MNRLTRPFRVNEAVVRGVAFQVFLLALWGAVTGSAIPVIFLGIDFLIRALLFPQISLLALVSKKVLGPLNVFKARMILFKPKRFAAGIGLFMSLAALGLLYFQFTPIARIVLAVLVLFSGLESFFAFCAGCKIFQLLIKLRIVKNDFCQDCSLGDGDGI